MWIGVKSLLLTVCLLVPQLAAAKVYMCVDPATGKTSFTDNACPSKSSGEVVRVHDASPGSGAGKVKRKGNKAWQSQRNTALSGQDYNQQRRDKKSPKVAASAR